MNEVIVKFNETLIQFLDEIHRIFPCSKAYKYSNLTKISLTFDKTKCIELFMNTAVEHEEQIMKNDNEYFLNDDIEFVKHLEFNKYYKKADKYTKDIMWKYIQTLYILGCAYINRSPKITN